MGPWSSSSHTGSFPRSEKGSHITVFLECVRGGSGQLKGSWAVVGRALAKLGRLLLLSGPQFPSLQSHLLVGVEVSVAFLPRVSKTAAALRSWAEEQERPWPSHLTSCCLSNKKLVVIKCLVPWVWAGVHELTHTHNA